MMKIMILVNFENELVDVMKGVRFDTMYPIVYVMLMYGRILMIVIIVFVVVIFLIVLDVSDFVMRHIVSSIHNIRKNSTKLLFQR